MTPYLETITSEQRQAMDVLSSFIAEREMYLAGGTAVALQLGHRRSEDLDWFGQSAVDDPLRLAQDLRSAEIPFQTSVVDRGTLHGTIFGVRVSFLEYQYPLLEPPLVLPGLQCRCAALRDLAAMKLVAVAQRGLKKDFTDIYAIGRSKLAIDEMLEAYRRKFSIEDTSRVLFSLTYFDDAEAEPMPRMLWDIDWQAIKDEIRQWVKAAAR